MVVVRSWLPLALVLELAACGSDPLRSPSEGEDAGRGGRSAGGKGSSGTSGSSGGGSAGTDGSNAGGPPVPDYTLSPCYGQPAETEVYDLATHEVSTVTATCRAQGNRTLFYVADD